MVKSIRSRGELFVAECRVKIDQAIGDMYDSTFGICSDDGMQLAFGLFPDRIESIWEDNVTLSVNPDTFHEYRVLSWDMQTYELYIDGDLVHEGTFWQGLARFQACLGRRRSRRGEPCSLGLCPLWRRTRAILVDVADSDACVYASKKNALDLNTLIYKEYKDMLRWTLLFICGLLCATNSTLADIEVWEGDPADCDISDVFNTIQINEPGTYGFRAWDGSSALEEIQSITVNSNVTGDVTVMMRLGRERRRRRDGPLGGQPHARHL